MQLAFLTGLFEEHAPTPVKAPAAKPATAPAYERYTIEADRTGVSIIAPAQQVATAPFQPIAERTSLPGLFLRYRWHDIQHLFAAYDGCEDMGSHPAAPWIERIIKAIEKTDALTVTIEPVYAPWIRITLRSMWTGLDRSCLLRQAERAHIETHAQAVARGDAVAARLRAGGRVAVIRDRAADVKPEPAAPRIVAEPQQVRIGALVITIGASPAA